MIRSLFLLLLCGLLAGCSKENTPIEFINLNQDFTLTLNQYLSDEGSYPLIRVQTTNMVNCSNSTIRSEHHIDINGINMTIFEILTEGDCAGGTTYASTEQEVVLPDGQFPFTISISEITEFIGQLIISEDSYQLVLDDQEGINVNRKSLQRIPSQLIWGYIRSSDLDVSELYQLMIAGLSDLAVEKNDLIAGDYDFFNIYENEPIAVNNAPHDDFTYHFILEHHDDISGISDYFKHLRNNNPNIDIQVQESSGIQF